MVIKKLWPVIWVKYEDTRSVMKHPSISNIYTKTVKNTLSVLEEMVANKTSEHMSRKIGSIIHDGWSSDGVIILECLHLMNSKKVTMHQKLKLIAYQFHPCIFFK